MPLKLPVQPYKDEMFAAYLRRVRRMKDDPQRVLVAIFGSQAVASRIEHGQLPHESTYEQLAEYLSLPLQAVSTWVERESLSAERAKLQRRLSEVDARLAELSPRRR